MSTHFDPSRGAAALAVLAALALGGCQCGAGDGERVLPRRREALAVPPPPIRILSETQSASGESPATLRYHVPEGSKFHLEKVVTATVSELIDTEKQPKKTLPAVTTAFELRAARGALAVEVMAPEIAAGAPDARAHAAAQLARYRTLLAGVKGRIAADDRGRLGRVGALFPGDGGELARRELAAALVDALVVLPPGPAGVGARWRVTRAVPRGASAVKQIADYRLVARDGDRLTVAVELLTVGERQPIALPNLPAGAHAEMLALRVFVEGQVVVDLASPTPLSAELTRRDKIQVRAVAAGRTLHDYYSESEARITLATRRDGP